MPDIPELPNCPDVDIEDEDRYWGRPQLPPGEHMDATVTVQVRYEIKAAWQAAAATEGVSLAEWVRRKVALFEGKNVPAALSRAHLDRNLARQVAALANNVNQIARQVNAGALVGQVDDVIAAVAVDALVDLHDDLSILTSIAMPGANGPDAETYEADG